MTSGWGFDPKNVTPVPSNWFSTTIEYKGWGRAEFLNPKGAVEGPTSIRFDEVGTSSIQLDVERFESEEHLQLGLHQLLTGAKPFEVGEAWAIGIGIARNTCTLLRVTTPDGVFSATEQVHFGFGSKDSDDEGHRDWLRFYLPKSQFDVSNSQSAKYWALPLSNFLSDFMQHHPSIDRHPLRIYPTPIVPDGLTEQDRLFADSFANSMNRLILFEFNSGIGFVEPLPDYKEKKDELTSLKRQDAVTAIMVGEIGTNPAENFDAVKSWFPFDFVRLAGLATGAEIGAPWIEIRDSYGQLLRRIHVSLGNPPYVRGHHCIDEVLSRGIGYLLTKSTKSPYWGQSILRVVLRHAIRGGLQTQSTLEDRFNSLCRALETLCKHFGLDRQQLLDSFDASQKTAVVATLDAAARQIDQRANAAVTAQQPDDASRLSRIASRIRNSANIEKEFGLAVVDLLQHFQMPDAGIVNEHYRTNPRSDNRNTWQAVLSFYRGTVIHEGYFDFAGNRHDLQDVLTLINHMHDILGRIIFQMLGYDGTYTPTVAEANTCESVDWVKPDTPADRLGYR